MSMSMSIQTSMSATHFAGKYPSFPEDFPYSIPSEISSLFSTLIISPFLKHNNCGVPSGAKSNLAFGDS